ncbi:MAG: type I secretion system permease/ATPase, partial [Thiomicrorhabdus sp.]|nr:type I secretion system permease/ATPase [Thiomicrorhabdus sp.]
MTDSMASKNNSPTDKQTAAADAPETADSSVTAEIMTNQSASQELYSPLLDCLVIYTKLNRQPFSKSALIAGLPIDKDEISPEMLSRAAERANLIAHFKERQLEDISNLVLPCILTLKNRQACILESID